MSLELHSFHDIGTHEPLPHRSPTAAPLVYATELLDIFTPFRESYTMARKLVVWMDEVLLDLHTCLGLLGRRPVVVYEALRCK